MRVKVTRKFIDRHTGEAHFKGDVLEITEERYQEIASVGDFVFPLNEDEQKDAPDDMSSDGLDEMSIRELKEYADKAYKLTFKGNMKKAEMIEELRRIKQHG